MAAFKLSVNTEAITKMVADNEHNKYTMLYYLLRRRAERGDLDVEAESKKIEDKVKKAFQSENEKTTEIKYRPTATLHQRTDSLQLKTLKNRDFYEGPISDRIAEKPSGVVLEFREKVTFSSKVDPSNTLFKNRSLCDDEVGCPPTNKASKSEGKKPTKVGVTL